MPTASPSKDARYRMNTVAPSIRLRLAPASSCAAAGAVSAAGGGNFPRGGGGAAGDVGHGLHPEGERLPRVGLGQDRLDRRPVGQGYRLVVADDGPIQGQL